jgi:toxin-antitoxin system, antitoxin component, ribbon-helix-helix fold
MAVITLKVSEEEKLFLQSMAKFEGKSLSELIRKRTLASLEDEYDAKIADMKLEEYEKYLSSGGEVLNWDEL